MVDSNGAACGDHGLIKAGLIDQYHSGTGRYGNGAARYAEGRDTCAGAVCYDHPLVREGLVGVGHQRNGLGGRVSIVNDCDIVPFGVGSDLIIHRKGNDLAGKSVAP